MMKTALNFNWQYKLGFSDNDLKGFKEETVDLPHANKVLPFSYFSEEAYQFISTYQKTFTYKIDKTKRLFVKFYGVMTKAVVYLNETCLGEHIGGYTAFKFELTDLVKEGLNTLTVKVDSKESSDHPPFGHVVDYLTYGGIYREVELIETALDTFDYIHVDGNLKTLHIKPYVNAITNQESTITFKVIDGDKTLIKHEMKKALKDLEPISLNHTLTLWEIDNPKLYTLRVEIDGYLAFETTFGVRTIRVDAHHFYLNDKVIFLRGLNRHQSYPYVGYAMPKSAQIEDAEYLKNTLGVSIVRSSHYPPSQHFLDHCDKIGLLVFTELPGWQHIGDDTWKKHALNDLESLVMHDYNHPSIVIIGTRINESKDDHDFYTKTRDLVKSIDQTRPTGGVRFFSKSELLEDIYTLNDFHHRGFNKGLSLKKKNTSLKHPYLITEHNGHMFPTKSFDHEQKRIDQTLRHLNVLEEAHKQQGIMGAIGWCMADYNTHKDFGSNDHICHHGVSDMFRVEKYAASAYASQRDKPYLNVLSMMHIGELASGELTEIVVATNLDAVKMYKNDAYIGTFTKKDSRYKHLKHPPIIIKDFIGDLIKDNERFNEKDATTVKNIILDTLNNHQKMRLTNQIKLGLILMKYKMNKHDAINLYTKYVGGWGEASKVYRFEGIKDGKTLLTVRKGHNDHYTLKPVVSKEALVIEDTYDTCKVSVYLSNDFDELAYYAKEVISVNANEFVEIIGPKSLVFQGGVASFYVKSKAVGKGIITITSDRFESIELTIPVN